MKTNYTKIFVIVFIVMLSIPVVLTLLKIKTQPINEGEKPISLNFKRNFPLKADLLKLYSNIKTTVLEVNPIPNRVIDTKNEWKFLGNEFSNVLSESIGLINSSKEEIEAIKKVLIERNNWCEANGIKFYLAVPPNKHTIYGNKIPIKKSAKKTKMQQLDSLCQTIGVKYINLGEKFPSTSTRQLYYKTDTHWNDYAGFYAYKAAMENIKKDFKDTNFIDFELSDMEEEILDLNIGDLNVMLMQRKSEDFVNLKFKNTQTYVRLENQLEAPKDYYKNPATYEARSKSETNDLKLLVLHDSYFAYFSNYFAANFGKTVSIWNFKFDKELILKEKPDILFHEILERDTELLLQ